MPRRGASGAASRCSSSTAARCCARHWWPTPTTRSTTSRCRASSGWRTPTTTPPMSAVDAGDTAAAGTAGHDDAPVTEDAARAAVRRVQRRERLRWAPAVALLLALSFAVRVWGAKQGLPYAYNADENAHFVPKAIGLFGHGWNTHYFVNPPAYTYLLHVVFAVWFGGREGVSRSYAADPTEVFFVARVVAAACGTIAVWLLYLAG